MRQKKLTHIIEKRFDSFCEQLPALDLLNGDAIHKWRVDYKKTRAVIRVSKETAHHLKIPLSLKEIYTFAGKVRDRQVQISRINELVAKDDLKPNNYVGILEVEMSSFADELHPLSENDTIIRIARFKITDRLPEKLGKHKLKSFVEKQLTEVRNILWLTYKKDDYLHNCRKHIKDVQYLEDLMGHKRIQALHVRGLPPFEELETATDELGKFNDQCVAIRFMSSSYLNRLPADEKDRLAKIRTELQRAKTKMKNEVIHLLERIFKVLLESTHGKVTNPASK